MYFLHWQSFNRIPDNDQADETSKNNFLDDYFITCSFLISKVCFSIVCKRQVYTKLIKNAFQSIKYVKEDISESWDGYRSGKRGLQKVIKFSGSSLSLPHFFYFMNILSAVLSILINQVGNFHKKIHLKLIFGVSIFWSIKPWE